MSDPLGSLCRLCVTQCERYVPLHKVYLGDELVINFIHEKLLLDVSGGSQEKFLCTACLEALHSFHSFCQMVSQAQYRYRQLQLQYIADNFNSDALLSLSLPQEVAVFDPEADVFVSETAVFDPEVAVSDLALQQDSEDTKYYDDTDDIDNLLDDDFVPEDDEFVSKDIEQTEAFAIQSIQDPTVRCQRATEAVLNKYQIKDMIKNKDFILNNEQKEEILLLFCAMKCSECPDKPAFKRYKELSEHSLMKHKSPCKVMCCDDVLRLRLTLERHIINKHLNPWTKRARCEICKKMVHELNLPAHIKNHIPMDKREFKCELCPSGFSYKHGLKNHMKLAHLSEVKQCNICNKDVKNLLNHMKIHKAKRDPKPFLCSQCGKEYKLKTSLDSHFKSYHSVQKEEKKKAKCPKCHIVMLTVSLSQHMRKQHSGEKQMTQCPHCPEKMVADLVGHMRAAHGEKKYSCGVCPMKFNTKNTLTDHTASRHSGIPRHKCEFCGRTFNSNGNFFLHRKRMHSAQLAEKKLEEMKRIQSEDIPVFDPVKKRRKGGIRVEASDVEEVLQALQTISRSKDTTVTDHNDDDDDFSLI